MQHAKVTIIPRYSSDPKIREAVHDGVRFVGGTIGQEYGIKVENLTRGRILAVITVDGRNVIDASPGDTAGQGYVISSGVSFICDGWRVSNEAVASFVFTEGVSSYAVATLGDASNVGVIGVAVFVEEPVPRTPNPSLYGGFRGSLSSDVMRGVTRSAGTGFGEERDSRVTSTTFRRHGEPEIHTIHYDTIAMLIEDGIMPHTMPKPSQPFPSSVPAYCPRPSTQIG